MLPVAILAGGLATRLRPITQTIPKSMVEVAGEPFVAHQLRYLRAQGVQDVVLCIGHLGEQVQAFVGDGSRFGLRVRYSPDGPVLLGTGGALCQALPLLGSAFFVLYGDSYLPIDFRQVQQAWAGSGRPALMTVLRNEGRWDRSNVEFEGGSIRQYNKKVSTPAMQAIDYGLSVLEAQLLHDWTDKVAFDLADLLHELSVSDRLAAFEVHQRFYEIGSHEGLRETTIHLQETRAMTSYSRQHLDEAVSIIAALDVAAIERMAEMLAALRQREGRLFFLGVGGSAGNCSHAVNDFRKIVGIESYAPTDNVSELTARTNDEGWSTIFSEWLKVSRLGADDAVFVFSVGGGNLEKNVSPNLVTALQHAKSVGAAVLGVVGRDGGYTAQVADACVIIPTVNPETITPHSEAFQAVVWHLLVSHPLLKARQTKWESVAR